jgi:cAMP-dependent protein kinase regulator
LSKQAELTAEAHEGHPLQTDKNVDAKNVRGKRPSVVQTNMELTWMDEIPALYGVSDSEELREELQEDGQAAQIQACVARQSDVETILKEWMHDCPNKDGLDKFIAQVHEQLQCIDRSSPTVKKVRIVEGEDGGSKRAVGRKGTGFVTSGQVRSLMAQDFGDESDDSEESDEQDDAEFEAEVARRLEQADKSGKARDAVSSERHEIDENWKPPVFPKTEDQRTRIANAISESFMFAALSFAQLQPVIDAFEELAIESGTTVIEQGAMVGPTDRGLYVLENGSLDVFVKGKEGAVFTYTEMGQYFGDLALLYNAPRSATVISGKPSVLWCIDRTTFNCLVKDAVQKAKERRMAFLGSVELLKSLNIDEVAKIGDALRERTFGTGVAIIQEGTEGDTFYILEKGACAAIKDGNRVKEYKPADYFGELALLSDAPRAADVITTEESIVLSLDRAAFQRMLGGLDTLMKERAASYQS